MDRRAYGFSALLHVGVLLLLFVQLPFFRARPLDPPPIIPVEVVSISKLTKSPPKKSRKQKKVAKTKKETKKAAPKERAKAVKKKQKAKPQKIKKVAAASKPKPKPKKDAVPPLEKGKASKQKGKASTSAKAKKDTDLKPKKNAAEKQQKSPKKTEDDFMSVLQAVNEIQRTKTVDPDAKKQKAIESENIADKISLSELDALRQQLQKCWNVPAGAMNAEDLIVDVRVTMGPDAVVQKVEIIDESRMHKDAFFRTAAESAKRALFAPECTPLRLPKDRYDQWQSFVIRFNPKDLA